MSERHNDKEWIDKEDWRKAPGVIVGSYATNSALSARDYSVPCDVKHCITIIQGYWLWWCSAHHQPLDWCEKARLDERVYQYEDIFLSFSR